MFLAQHEPIYIGYDGGKKARHTQSQLPSFIVYSFFAILIPVSGLRLLYLSFFPIDGATLYACDIFSTPTRRQTTNAWTDLYKIL